MFGRHLIMSGSSSAEPNPRKAALVYIPGDASPHHELVISLDSQITPSDTSHNLLDNQLYLSPDNVNLTMQVPPLKHQASRAIYLHWGHSCACSVHFLHETGILQLDPDRSAPTCHSNPYNRFWMQLQDLFLISPIYHLPPHYCIPSNGFLELPTKPKIDQNYHTMFTSIF